MTSGALAPAGQPVSLHGRVVEAPESMMRIAASGALAPASTTGPFPMQRPILEGTGPVFSTQPQAISFGNNPEPAVRGVGSVEQEPCRPAKKSEVVERMVGLTLGECGCLVHQRLLEVLPLRSQSLGERKPDELFPLPTSRDVLVAEFSDVSDNVVSWLLCVCLSLNSFWGGVLHSNEPLNTVQKISLRDICTQIGAFCSVEARIEDFSWSEFFKVRSIDYKGEEVKVALRFSWANIEPALPAEVGTVPLVDVCELGCQNFVRHVDQFLKPEDEMSYVKPPRVMVSDDDWPGVCQGLVDRGVCRFIVEEDVYHVKGQPLLNGLFGVSKDEVTGEGIEIHRLIMNLIPFNEISLPLTGDVETLPSWSMMSPFFLQPHENLLVSSEDVKCFFYTMTVPDTWCKFLAFNKAVPPQLLPPELQGRTVYLASKVLPMGYLNSVSIAQHVHRNLVLWSGADSSDINAGHQEFRKDRPISVANPNWRVYLDNYDLLERVEKTQMVNSVGSLSPAVLSLRQEYEHWEVPRNAKKSVSRSSCCEVQGASVDGVSGCATPRDVKLCKYFALGMALVQEKVASQKQWQVTCGGLVYFSMFRRNLLGCLNKVWSHVEEFNQSPSAVKPVPDLCRVEVLRFLGLLPLARLNFRLPMHPMVTCSDASASGGGLCASKGTSAFGAQVALGGLRGEVPEFPHFGVVCISLFDGIGALRVSLELLGVRVLGYVAVEKHAPARRVVEAHYPGVWHYDDVENITAEDVRAWSLKFSQATLVIVGAGPPCQGVSGLNVDRKGALRDCRSGLHVHVPRIRQLVREHFVWCPTYSLMESVSSMDGVDRDIMSESFGGSPVSCNSDTLCWCSRPRLYWVDWELVSQPGVVVDDSVDPTAVTLEGQLPLELVIRKGWLKVDPQRAFPTFTTSRPRLHPGRRPAGIARCSAEELQRWEQDLHRFPPYQYKGENCLVNRRDELRIPDIGEREVQMGFPLHFTAPCLPKHQQKGEDYNDCRLSLIGNSWCVPVVACLLEQLFARLGFIPHLSPQDILDATMVTGQPLVQGRITRLPLNPSPTAGADASAALALKMGNLISIKGEDILLTTPTTQLTRFHRLRATVPAKLWHWKTVSGWRWRGSAEHINSLELRAVLTSLRLLGAMFTRAKTLPTSRAGGVVGSVPASAMPKRKLVEAAQPKARAQQRQNLGTLRELTVQPATRRRYNAATDKFLLFLRNEGKELPRDKHKLDPLVCDYVEHLWASGAGRALASDTLAGLQDLQPGLKSHLPGAWRLLKTWNMNEIPSRAPPIPEHILQAMIGWCFFNQYYTFGISLALGYYGMLRSGEIIGLRSSHILGGASDTQLVVSLGMTKGGKRQGAAESVIVGLEPIVKLVQRWKQLAQPSTPLATSAAKWRTRFSEVLTALQITECEFRPYSLRRGGATWWFQKHQSLDRILVQGRHGAHRELFGTPGGEDQLAHQRGIAPMTFAPMGSQDWYVLDHGYEDDPELGFVLIYYRGQKLVQQQHPLGRDEPKIKL
eukprot:Skav224735  [mRNA]  locus=scaffold3343:16799:24817:- [translate_table: standard]